MKTLPRKTLSFLAMHKPLIISACLLGAFVVDAVHCQAQLRLLGRKNAAATQTSPPNPTVQIRSDMEYLASDDLRGRGVGDASIDQAAAYLVERMKAIGLSTDVWQKSPLQPFNVTLGAKPTDKQSNYLELSPSTNEQTNQRWQLGDGFTPLTIGSALGKVTAPLIFAGYGITAPELNYDDYQGIDAKGAIVIVLRKEPQRTDEESRFSGTQNTKHALFSAKIKNAIDHGASALILVNDSDSVLVATDRIDEEKKREETRLKKVIDELASITDENQDRKKQLSERKIRIESSLIALDQDLSEAQRGVLGISEAGRRRPNDDSIPVVSIGRDVLDQSLMKYCKVALSTLEEQIDQTGEPASKPLAKIDATISVGIEPLNTETNNVLGVLPGKGPLAEETVIVGAHYDHVGMGGNGSLAPGTIAVHNGADDNASGTVAMLAIAKQAISELASKASRRRLVFIGFSGEERGLLGSKHYVKQPRFPLEDTVSMINLDMVGRLNDNELTVYGTGSGENFDSMVDRLNEKQATPFKLFKMSSGYGPSDHQSFNEAGIPVLFFFTGIHNDYHRPSDDFDKINFGGLTRITDIVSDVVSELATQESRPVFAETDKRVQIRRQMTAFLGVSLTDDGDRVSVADLVGEGPASQGGIQKGDQIIKLGNQNVSTAEEVIDWVRSKSPGDEAKIIIDRLGKSVELTVELGKRPAQ